MSKGEWCRYSSGVLCQEASGCSGCEIYPNRNTGSAGARRGSSILPGSIAKAGFFQVLTPIINPHPAFACSTVGWSSYDQAHNLGIVSSNLTGAFPAMRCTHEQETGAIELSLSNPHSPGSRASNVERACLILKTTTIIPYPAFSYIHYYIYDNPQRKALFPGYCSSERDMRLLDSISSIAPSFESANKK